MWLKYILALLVISYLGFGVYLKYKLEPTREITKKDQLEISKILGISSFITLEKFKAPPALQAGPVLVYKVETREYDPMRHGYVELKTTSDYIIHNWGAYLDYKKKGGEMFYKKDYDTSKTVTISVQNGVDIKIIHIDLDW